ncbi:MAG: DUF433 domain-containing protein [Ignavibacteria bacterium]|nr:DUF433 domain-containing protein [Ignavibacteria bacterium]
MNATCDHIQFDEQGIPFIAGTKIKVVEIIVEYLAYAWSPEEIHFQHPNLSLGQIHTALAYYWDNQEKMDAEIKNRIEKIDKLNNKHSNLKLNKKFSFEKTS